MSNRSATGNRRKRHFFAHEFMGLGKFRFHSDAFEYATPINTLPSTSRAKDVVLQRIKKTTNHRVFIFGKENIITVYTKKQNINGLFIRLLMNRVFFSEQITGSFSLTFVAVVEMELFNRTFTDRDLVSQSMMLCRYFMCSRIIREGLSWSKVEPGLPAPDGALGDVLRVLLKLGDELDYLQPYLYRNVAKQLRISVATETMVIDAFLSVATEILSLGITWGKVVAIFAVAGGLAVDCVRQGHPAMLHTIVESLGELVGKSLASWLKKRGGWGDISKCVTSLDNTAQYHWLSAVVSTWRHLVKTMYVYLMK